MKTFTQIRETLQDIFNLPEQLEPGPTLEERLAEAERLDDEAAQKADREHGED